MKAHLKADIMLILVTLCWGVSYYLMDLALADLGPFTLSGYRFLFAFAVAGILSLSRLKTVSGKTFKYSLLIGTSLVFVYMGATFGVKYTTLSNAGFLCSLTVIFVPIIEFIFLRRAPEKKMIFAVTLSFIGIMLLTLKDDFSLNLAHIKGDVMSVISAVAYAVDLLITEKAVSHKEVDAFQLGVLELGVTGIYMSILSFVFEKPHFPSNPVILGILAFLSVFCTGVAFIVQAVAQKYTTASHVGVIFTLEPVFAAIVAFVFAKEVLSVKSYIGAAIMVAALFITEIDFGSIKRIRENRQAEQP